MIFNPSPSFSFGSSKKITQYLLLPQISRGPASYNIVDHPKNTALNFGQYSQRKFHTEMDTPGPMTYNPKCNLNHTTGISFSHSHLSKSKKPMIPSIPGPGQYEIEVSHSKLGGIINTGRRLKTYSNGIPGVGSYQLKDQSSIQSHTFRQTKSIRQRNQFPYPSPGQYQIQSPASTPGIKMVTTKRTWSYIQKSTTPGPGSYTIEEKKVKEKKIAPTLRRNKTVCQPEFMGSEALDRLKDYGKLKVTFKKQERKEEFLDEFNCSSGKKIERSPGPARYGKIDFKPKQKIGRFFESQRVGAFQPKEGPGVGSYNTMQPFGKVYKKAVKKKTIRYKISDQMSLDFID